MSDQSPSEILWSAVPAYSLTYRPQKVAQLDHETVKSFFQDLLKSGQIPHALLFAGPKGTGKTSAGRILAKLLNCQKNKSWRTGKSLVDACGKCSDCQEIAAGSYLDLIEIDAASNRGIGEIRSLREKIKLAPSRGRVKVYLIDEVHMLTTEAFNALLKTLEEPPEHAYFVLATTEPDRLPDTIRSRCLEIQFSRASLKEIKNSLKRVLRSEKLEVEPEVLEVVAAAADGSFRDAQKLLERLSFQGGKITTKAAKELLSFGQLGSGRRFLELVAKRETTEALKWLADFVTAGRDPLSLVRTLLGLIHGQILYLAGAGGEKVEELEPLPLESLTDLASRLNKAGSEIKTAVLPQLPLELAVIEWGMEGVGQVKASGEPAEKPCSSRVIKAESEEKVVEAGEIPVETKTKTGHTATMVSSLGEVADKVQDRWSEILARLKPHNGSITGLLRSCRVKGFDGRFLEIEAFYSFHHEKLQSEKVRRVIENVIGEVLGTPMRIRCILGKKPAEIKKAEIANVLPAEGGAEDLAVFAERLFGVE